MSRVFIYPAVNLDNLQADKSLEVTDDTISLKGEESSVTILNSYVVIDDVELCGSVAVLKHLAEHHDYLMIASEMFYGKGEDFFDDMLKNMFDESHSIATLSLTILPPLRCSISVMSMAGQTSLLKSCQPIDDKSEPSWASRSIIV